MHLVSRHRVGVAIGCAWAAAAFFAEQSLADDTRFGLNVDYAYDDNVNRAAVSSERKPDSAVSAEGYGTRAFPLSEGSGIVVRGAAQVSQYLRFDDLSNLTLDGRATYRIQPVPGYTMPWLEIAAGGQWLKFRDSGLRDGTILFGSAGIGSWVTDRIRFAANAGRDWRRAREGEVYDGALTRLWATLDYRLPGAATLYGSATRLSGDQVFTASSGTAQTKLANWASASAPDPVFAGAFGGVAPIAYRLEATTLVYEAGVNFPLSGMQAIDASAGYFDAKSMQGGQRYAGATARLSYLVRFR